MVNDAEPKKANCVMRPIFVDGTIRLCLFSNKLLNENEELRYDYGLRDLPWRKKMAYVSTTSDKQHMGKSTPEAPKAKHTESGQCGSPAKETSGLQSKSSEQEKEGQGLTIADTSDKQSTGKSATREAPTAIATLDLIQKPNIEANFSDVESGCWGPLEEETSGLESRSSEQEKEGQGSTIADTSDKQSTGKSATREAPTAIATLDLNQKQNIEANFSDVESGCWGPLEGETAGLKAGHPSKRKKVKGRP
ncbi:hypothetical protein BSL78_13609 [Apostichopus japonicus]|uniref:SET domain-containing protein n=1 Tax=Stichopus japonicus TaxID=307972 RepID=A0A2G8KNC1_STIJA|nr:hypothetical protein BSL78_13609 [Apostichopus japonicus]